jgi:hypothetical protein
MSQSEELGFNFSSVELASKKFDELTTLDPPNALFHYTNQSGLLGILDHRELWATKVQYMNDSTEFGVAIELARKILEIRIKSTNDNAEKSLFEFISNRLNGISYINICSVSFCGKPDLLSQWRGYAGNGGFSIGFKSKLLADIAAREGFRLGHCIYNEQDQAFILTEMLDDAVFQFVKMDGAPEEKIPQIAKRFEKALIKFGAFFKDSSFEEEGEWRLVTSTVRYHDDKFCFRPGKSMLIPFFRISLTSGCWTDEIVEIFIGPCPHPQISRQAVLGLLLKHQISKGSGHFVVESKIPFRNW